MISVLVSVLIASTFVSTIVFAVFSVLHNRRGDARLAKLDALHKESREQERIFLERLKNILRTGGES
jgi:hypothetical protein